MSQQDIRLLNKEALKEAMLQKGEKSFRALQVYEWLWKKSALSFDEMTNLPKDLRAWLQSEFVINPCKVVTEQKSADGTLKCLFELHDGKQIEGVLIPTAKRMTACVSSQVGCSLDCTFCATGYLKRQRNLYAYEIYDQVMVLNRLAMEHFGVGLSNIVFMGMGEPLLNYSNVLDAIRVLTEPDAWGMSAKRITVSTAGIVKMIYKLADEGIKVNLALSLHSANNTKRSEIMPINRTNTLDDLVPALTYFYEKTGNRITLEYAVMNDTNDGTQEIQELVTWARKIPSVKVNLIEYNPIDSAHYQSPGIDKIEQFASALKNKGVLAVIRRSRGKDIDAACGQLANKASQLGV